MKKLVLSALLILVGCVTQPENSIQVQPVPETFESVNIEGGTILGVYTEGEVAGVDFSDNSPDIVNGWLAPTTSSFEIIYANNSQAGMVWLQLDGPIDFIFQDGAIFENKQYDPGSVVKTIGCTGQQPYRWDWDLTARETKVEIVDNDDGTKLVVFESDWEEYGFVYGQILLELDQ